MPKQVKSYLIFITYTMKYHVKCTTYLRLYHIFFVLQNVRLKKIFIFTTINIFLIICVNIYVLQTLSNDLFFVESIMMGLLIPYIILMLIKIVASIIIILKNIFAIYQASSVRAPDFLRATIKRPEFRQPLVVVVIVAGWGYYRFQVAPTLLTALLGRAVYSFPVEASLLVISLVWYFCWSESAIVFLVFGSLVIGELIPNIYSPQREMPASFAYFLLVWVIVRYLLESVVAAVSRCVRPLAIANPRDTNLRPIGSDDLGNGTQVS